MIYKLILFISISLSLNDLYCQEMIPFKGEYKSAKGSDISIKIVEKYSGVEFLGDSMPSFSITHGRESIVTFKSDSIFSEFSPGDTCFGTFVTKRDVWYLKSLFKKNEIKLFFKELKSSMKEEDLSN